MLALELGVVTGIQAQLAPVEMDDRCHDRVEKIAVVGDEQQRSGIPLQPLLEPEHGVEIEMVGRLIEQQQIRARHQRLRQVEPHAPPAREARHRLAVARRRKAQAGEQHRRARARTIAIDRLVTLMQFREQFAGGARIGLGVCQCVLHRAQLGIAVEHELDRRNSHCGSLLRHMPDDPRRWKRHVARVGIDFAAQQGEQRRFAAAVGPDQPDLVTRMDRERGAFEQALVAAREGEVSGADQRRSKS